LVVVFTHVVHEALHWLSQVDAAMFKKVPALQEVQVLAAPTHVAQFESQAEQVLPVKKNPAEHAVQLIVRFWHAEHPVAQWSSQVLPAGFMYLPAGQEVHQFVV